MTLPINFTPTLSMEKCQAFLSLSCAQFGCIGRWLHDTYHGSAPPEATRSKPAAAKSNIGSPNERNCNSNVPTSKQKIPNNTSMDHSEETRNTNTQNQNGLVHVMPLECQSNGRALNSAIRPMLGQCVQRCVHRRKLSYKTVLFTMDCTINILANALK